MKHSTFTWETPVIGVLDAVNAQRRDGENSFDAFKRLALDEALSRFDGNATKAGEALGITQQRVSYLKSRKPRAWATVHPKERDRSKVTRFPKAVAAGSFMP
jgi:hypothetical protein